MKCSKHQTTPTRCFGLTFLPSYLPIFLLFPSLVVAYDFAGGTGDPNVPYQIATAAQLISMGSDPTLMDKHFVLLNDIDLDPNLPDGRVFTDAVIAPPVTRPDGEIRYLQFDGRFDGNGFAVRNLAISGEGGLGLFSALDENAQVIDLGVLNAKITARFGTSAGIAGSNEGTITQCHSTGNVSGPDAVGGLVGFNAPDAVINDCYSSAAVSGERDVGGLVGTNFRGIVTDCHSIGSVSWTGLNPENTHSFGGLIGANWGAVTSCYSRSATSGMMTIGGLVGTNRFSNSSVSNCYSTGAVSGAWGYIDGMDSGIGGLVGWNQGEVKHSYSTGRVSSNEGNASIGGLIGYQRTTWGASARTIDCFWDINTSGLDRSAAGTGLSTREMQDIQTFLDAEWDFVDETRNGVLDVWRMPDSGGYPILGQPTEFNFSGRGTLDDPYLISTVIELSSVRRFHSSAFKLMADIDLAGSRWSTAIVPEFSGSFNGNGFVISNMTLSGSDGDLGLFGKIEDGAEVFDLGVVDVNITNSGVLAGNTGGIVGENAGRIFNCFSSGQIHGNSSVGGIVGDNKADVSDCYSTTTVSGESKIGGIAGENKADVRNCYSTGEVRGNYAGGIVGENRGDVSNCYSTSVVSSDYPLTAGGLAGRIPNASDGITSSLWNTETSGQTESLGGLGLTTAQMQDISTYLQAGWDFTYSPINSPDMHWWMPKQDYPRLWWQYGFAYAPDPANGAADISPEVILQWHTGGPDLRQDVYFGDDDMLVANATRDSVDVYRGPLAAGIETYDPGVLQWGRTYYWRIDGINELDPNNPWKGEVWSFTTTDSVAVFIVDDFESYDDLCNRVFFTWQDGWGHSGVENINGCNVAPHEGNGSNALVGNSDPPFAEHVIVHGGAQSMPMDYDNEMWPWFSEVQRPWSTPRDWTDNDADTLVLYFRGEAGNSQDSLYVTVEDSHGGIAVIPNSDAQAVRAAEWRIWRIPLNDLATAGVDVTAVNKLIIGVGDRDNPQLGGTGRIYVDSIQLTKGVL